MIKAASADGFSGSSGALALQTSRRVNPAAGLRGLLDRRKATAIAGSALVFDPIYFCPLHSESRITAPRILISQPDPVASKHGTPRQQSGPNGAGDAELGPQAE
jgi:hypothetical protein